MKIGIFYGGNTIESDFSKVAAFELRKKISSIGEIFMFDLSNLKEWFANINQIDIAIPLVYGCPGQEGILQGLFDILSIPYLGSDLFTCSKIKDKETTKLYVKDIGIKTPNYVVLSQEDMIDERYMLLLKKIKYPVVIKPKCKGGLSLGIYYCNNTSELLSNIESTFKYDDTVLVEEYIDGKEIVACAYEDINGINVLPLIEIIKSGRILNYEEKKYGKKETIIPANISEDDRNCIDETTKEIFKKLHIKDYCYFDFIISNSNVYFIEAGCIPGLTSKSNFNLALDCSGNNIKTIIKKIIDRRTQNL